MVSSLEITYHNQSTESTDGDGCLKFYRPLELIGIYAENFSVPDIRPFSMEKSLYYCFVGPLLDLYFSFNAVNLAPFTYYSYPSANIVLNMIKLFKKNEVISIRVFKADNMFEFKTKRY